MDIKAYVLKKAKAAKEGARLLARASSKEKNNALLKMADALKKRKAELIKENKKTLPLQRKRDSQRR